MNKQFLRDFLKRWVVVWESADVDGIVSLCTEDVVMEAPAVPEIIQGRKAVADFASAFFRAFPKPRWELIGEPFLSLDSRRAALHWRFIATMHGPFYPPGFAPTQQQLEFPGVELYQFREGLLSHYTLFFDVLGMGRQIGAAPKPDSFGDRIGVLMQRMVARRMRKRASHTQ